MIQLTRGTLALRSHKRLMPAFLFVLSSVVAVNTAAGGPNPENRILELFRDAVFNHTLSESTAIQMHSEVLANINRLDDEASRIRGAALAFYYLGRYYHAIETPAQMVSYAEDLRKNRFLALRNHYTRSEKALAAYRSAIGPAEEYFRLNETAESHRVLGEIQGQMLFLGTVAEALSLGPKARRHVNAAREMDPGNIKALIQEASRFAYTPPAYGGNPDEARELYREALRNGNGDREDLFNIYGGFAMASFQEKNDRDAINWWNEALGVYPGNVFARGMLIFCERESK